jgi:hypothetical protein
MNLVVDRDECTTECTMGRLTVDNEFECFTLEDVVRANGLKIAGETAIPAGTYSVEISFSPRFKRDLPLVVNVAGFVGIRIHPGNDASDTEGCILVGRTRLQDRIGESRLAFGALFAKLREATNRGEPITLEVRNTATPVA